MTVTELTLSFPPAHQSSPPTLFSGDMDSAVEVLEEQYTRPDSVKPSIAFVFRKVLEENNEKAIDKCKTHKHSEYMCIEER